MPMGETGTEDEWMMGEAVGGGEQDERRGGNCSRDVKINE